MTPGSSPCPARYLILFAPLFVTRGVALPTSPFDGVAVEPANDGFGEAGISATTDSLMKFDPTSRPPLHAFIHEAHDWSPTDSSVVAYILRILDPQKHGHVMHLHSLGPSAPYIHSVKHSSTHLLRRQTGTDSDDTEHPPTSDDDDEKEDPHNRFPLYMKLILILAGIVGGILLILAVLWLVLHLSTRNSRSRRRDIVSSGSPFIPPRDHDYSPLLDDAEPGPSSRGGGGGRAHVRDDSLFYFPVAHAQEPYTDNEMHGRVVGNERRDKGKSRENLSRPSSYQSFEDPFSDSHGDLVGKRASRASRMSTVEEAIPNPFADHTPRKSEEIELRAFNSDG
ncbi:hypothetical protein D9758_015385 [Tetrapyrgos nigripes]|uniref:Uncharacterized protein n=1 Tax=Tetrapyrgos nigripes TaxID=182062 RepID=A0A8H5FIY7_9AGAR|nr:hypothetical protein D9758_015385 [Tetrapyrgos nigripes]